ncbi:hypothetical protein GW17_00025010 [Ensete ventricosum]|nr:hypothetical protein GW17_00025010 [Ensete ventricosum]
MVGRGATLVFRTSWFNCSSWIRAKEIVAIRVYGCRAFTFPRISGFRPLLLPLSSTTCNPCSHSHHCCCLPLLHRSLTAISASHYNAQTSTIRSNDHCHLHFSLQPQRASLPARYCQPLPQQSLATISVLVSLLPLLPTTFFFLYQPIAIGVGCRLAAVAPSFAAVVAPVPLPSTSPSAFYYRLLQPLPPLLSFLTTVSIAV